MKDLENLWDLLIEQARELYRGEIHEQWELKKIIKKTGDDEIREAIRAIIRSSEIQEKNLMKVFNLLTISPGKEQPIIMDSITREGKKLSERSSKSDIKDAITIETLRLINHYKTAAYETAGMYAEKITNGEITFLLKENLEIEKTAELYLVHIAKKTFTIDSQKQVFS